jgi:hypothetical protein
MNKQDYEKMLASKFYKKSLEVALAKWPYRCVPCYYMEFKEEAPEGKYKKEFYGGHLTKGKTYYAYDWCHHMVLQPETPVTVYTVVDDHFQLVDKSAECFENVRDSEYPIFEYTYNGKTYKPLDGDVLTPAFSKERKNKELHNFEELLKQRKVEYKVLEDDSAYYVLVHKKFSEKLLRIAIELVNDDIADYEDCVGEFILMQFNGEDQLWRFMED